ncbi:MAG: hypothetical protein ACE5LD_05190, partial [Candidatus Bipolaricaulia bacterium]
WRRWASTVPPGCPPAGRPEPVAAGGPAVCPPLLPMTTTANARRARPIRRSFRSILGLLLQRPPRSSGAW